MSRLRSLTDEYRSLAARLEEGGGAARVAKMHAQGKLAPRERVRQLLDPESPWLELGLLVAYDQYDGQAPGAGVITGVGVVEGRGVVVVANDATVKAGSWWPETIRKILRAQEVAMRQRIPIVYLVDSAGVNLPYQGGVFPGQYGAARIFYYNSIMRRYLHVPQISAVMGSCIAGGAYLPALSDVIFMVEGTSFMGLGGPNLVKGATGQTIDAETLGGARTHTELSAVAHYRAANDAECLKRIREYIGRLPRAEGVSHRRRAAGRAARPASDLYDLLPQDHRLSYDMRADPRLHPGRRRARRVPARRRPGDALRPRPYRGAAGRGDREPAGHHQGPARRAAAVRRHRLHRQRREGGLLHRDREPGAAADSVRPGRERVHGGAGGGAVRHHPRRGPIRGGDGDGGGAQDRAHGEPRQRARATTPWRGRASIPTSFSPGRPAAWA